MATFWQHLKIIHVTKLLFLQLRRFNQLLKLLFPKTPLSYNQTSVVSVEHNFKQIVGSVMSVEQRLLIVIDFQLHTRRSIMGLFSFFKKNKKSNTQATSDAVNTIFDAVTESVTAYNDGRR